MQRINSFFATIYTKNTGRGPDEETIWQPAVDIYEKRDVIVVVAEIPGIQKDKVDVLIERGVLHISGYRPSSVSHDATYVHLMEIPYGRFSRSLTLPSNCHPDKAKASYRNGYLTITIPRIQQNDK